MNRPQLDLRDHGLRASDEYGNAFVQFEVDYFAGEKAGVCTICEESIESGWLCLDGGEEYCHDCVDILD